MFTQRVAVFTQSGKCTTEIYGPLGTHLLKLLCKKQSLKTQSRHFHFYTACRCV